MKNRDPEVEKIRALVTSTTKELLDVGVEFRFAHALLISADEFMDQLFLANREILARKAKKQATEQAA